MIKEFSKIVNGDLESGVEIAKDLLDLSLEDTKKLLKELEKDLKNTQIGKQKKEFLGKYLKNCDKSFDFISGLNKYIAVKIQKEKERAWKFLTNKEESEKAGWFSKKPNEESLIKWGERAYPNLTLDYWETEVEVALLKSYFKTFSNDND